MTDQIGYRMKFGVVTPSVNTVVQPEYDEMRPRGVTNQVARIHIRDDIEITDEASWTQVVRNIDRAVDDAVERVLTCEPAAVIMGVSIEAVYGDAHAGSAIQARLRAKFGEDLTLVHAGEAIPTALRAYGIDEGPIGVLTPYQGAAEKHIGSFLAAHGYSLDHGVHIPMSSTVAIAQIPAQTVRQGFSELAERRPRAIVQFGANLAAGRVADEAERWLGLPVIAVNAATYWHALRTHGLPDQCDGYGRLLSEF